MKQYEFVCLRLGLTLCVPHQCHCGVDGVRILGFMASSVRGSRQTRQTSTLNDLVARAMASAGIRVSKEPQGLSRADGKRPDGLSLIPWQAGKPFTWDVTVVCLCRFVRCRSSLRSGLSCRGGSHSEVRQVYYLGQWQHLSAMLWRHSARSTTARRFSVKPGSQDGTFSKALIERLAFGVGVSLLIQRYNAILLHDSFVQED